MSENRSDARREMITKMIEMQKEFIAFEAENGVDAIDYFTPKEGHKLHGYRQDYNDLAMQLVDKAHEEVGSSR